MLRAYVRQRPWIFCLTTGWQFLLNALSDPNVACLVVSYKIQKLYIARVNINENTILFILKLIKLIHFKVQQGAPQKFLQDKQKMHNSCAIKRFHRSSIYCASPVEKLLPLKVKLCHKFILEIQGRLFNCLKELWK